jgi:arylsulfatase A-like enzyme
VKRPNLIWIFGDQHRAQALGCTGDPNLSTPVLDSLATSSRTAISGCPLCTPFRGSLLTGFYPHTMLRAHDDAMPDGVPTVATAFRKAGYRTAWFGKWHVDGAANLGGAETSKFQVVRPDRRGDFETWVGYENATEPFDCWVHGNRGKGEEIPHHKLPGYETDALTDILIDYVKSQGDGQPFFASLSVLAPHPRYAAPARFTARHDPSSIVLRPNVPPVARIQEEARQSLARYYAAIENLDWNVGRILAALDEAGLRENTIVMFFSDHGDMHGSQARLGKSVPWEESIRIPFCVQGPGIRTDLEHYTELINHVDIAPTSLGLCGIDPPAAMAGTDYSGAYREDRPELVAPDSAFIQLVNPAGPGGPNADRERPWRGIVTEDGWKYAVLEGQPWLLYNLNEDPYETANLALDPYFSAERSRLQERLAAWIEDTGDEFQLPADVVHSRTYPRKWW